MRAESGLTSKAGAKAAAKPSAKGASKPDPKSGAQSGCCDVHPTLKAGEALAPDHTAEMKRLNRIQGQLAGVGRMIEARRYCPEILMQTRAVVSAIKALEDEILEQHLRHCVRDAFQAKDVVSGDAKIAELMDLYRRRD